MNRKTPFFITSFFSGAFASLALLLLFHFLANDFTIPGRLFSVFSKPGLYIIRILNSVGLVTIETSLVPILISSSIFYGLFLYLIILVIGEN